jgi:hypothetical protein
MLTEHTYPLEVESKHKHERTLVEGCFAGWEGPSFHAYFRAPRIRSS